MEVQIHQGRIELVQGDITQEETEAIVNAANSRLMGGAGVERARSTAPGVRRSWPNAAGSAAADGSGRHHDRRNPQGPSCDPHGGPGLSGGMHGESELLKSAISPASGLPRPRGSGASPSRRSAPGSTATRWPRRPGSPSRRLPATSGSTPTLKRIRFVLFDRRTYDAFARELEKLV